MQYFVVQRNLEKHNTEMLKALKDREEMKNTVALLKEQLVQVIRRIFQPHILFLYRQEVS